MTAFHFDNSYSRLPEACFRRMDPVPVAAPTPIRVNRELAAGLGLDADWLASPAGTAALAGNAPFPGAEPLAAAYAGHQFGSFNPQLGDGRALLLGEILTPEDRRFDLQLKGSGPTPWSRGGDGRSPLGPVLREYLLSEAMAALGVPTTRALAAVSTGEPVYREQALPGAILARVASSHIRIGTLEYFYARKDTDSLRALVEHTLARHYPERRDSDNPALSVLEGVIQRQAALVARWQLLGFIHGVMNTDNMLLCGETIDYGPCAFMEAFDPATVFSSIDRQGRYAWGNQPGIAHWNLACLAQALLPLIHSDSERAVALAQAAADTFGEHFEAAHRVGLQAKLGFTTRESGDDALVGELHELMQAAGSDFTLTFRRLADLAGPDPDGPGSVAALFTLPERFDDWLARWRERLAREGADPAERRAAMVRANPVFIPRNHQVEAVIQAATRDDDFAPFHRLLERVTRPFDYDPADRDYALPATEEQRVRRTFCGT
jgi:uncharacterized protein YdiU (UPF0061 family)